MPLRRVILTFFTHTFDAIFHTLPVYELFEFSVPSIYAVMPTELELCSSIFPSSLCHLG
jgi:hypothetical protein